MEKRIFYTLVIFAALSFSACKQTDKKANDNLKLIMGLRMQEVSTVPFDSLMMNDPFILADEASNMYYMTGSGGTIWKSPDLKMWKGPYSYIEVDTTSWIGANPLIWAPELHKYNGKYYCFVTFTNSKIIVDTVPGRYNVQRRGTHILVSDKAEGPYRPINDNIYLPEKWSTLDGTLWVEGKTPYLVFSHEWMQTIDGEMKYIELSPDLTESVSTPAFMFKSSDAPWPREMRSIGELTFGMPLNGYVNDGPFLFRTGTGRLGMLWSSWSDKRVAQGVAYSKSGSIAGPWLQMEKPLVLENSGHAMLFRTFEGKTMMLMHYQGLEENPGPRKPILYEVDLSGNELVIIGKFSFK